MADERALWRRVRLPGGGAARPGEMDLAAFLDGRADAPARARVEAWLAGDPAAAGELRLLAARPAGVVAVLRRAAPFVAGAAAACLGLWLGYGLGAGLGDAEAGAAEALGAALFGAGDGL